ncbi:hypothetical protein Tco_1014825 [Tanacetum coccineum]
MIEPEPVKKFSKKDQLKLDKEVAQREQEELTIEERDKLFQQLLEKRRKHVASKREEEKGNRPPTRAQQRSIMCTYLKNMEGKKAKDLKKLTKLVEDEVDEDKETSELQSLMQVIPDEEEVAIDAIPLATKPPTIVVWKIHKEGKNSYYQIIRADRSLNMYRVVSHIFSKSDGHYYFRALYRKT